MEVEMAIPSRMPELCLPGAVLFPQAMLTIQLSEPKDCLLLNDSLCGSRVFALSQPRDDKGSEEVEVSKPAHTVALALIRACWRRPDSSFVLIAQGLARAQAARVIRENPYRVIEASPLETRPGQSTDWLAAMQKKVARTLNEQRKVGGDTPKDFIDFLKSIESPELFVDLAAFSLLTDPDQKQRILETLETSERFAYLLRKIQEQTAMLRFEKLMRRKAQEGGPDVFLN